MAESFYVKETKVYKTNYVARSIYLAKGKHKISLNFKPLSFEIGKYLTLASLVILAAYFLILVFGKVPKILSLKREKDVEV